MIFFSFLEKAVTDNDVQAHRIYKMDESGLNTVQKPPKVFASKGKNKSVLSLVLNVVNISQLLLAVMPSETMFHLQ